MALTLLLLLMDKRLHFALVELAAFLFVLLAALATGRSGQTRWLRWLVPMAVGLGLDPLARLTRLAFECIYIASAHVPLWIRLDEYYSPWAGHIILIYGTLMLYRMVRAEDHCGPSAEGQLGQSEVWPPSIRPEK